MPGHRITLPLSSEWTAEQRSEHIWRLLKGKFKRLYKWCEWRDDRTMEAGLTLYREDGKMLGKYRVVSQESESLMYRIPGSVTLERMEVYL